MKGITLDQYGQLHTYLLVQHGNVKISNLVLINAASYMEKNGTLDIWKRMVLLIVCSKRFSRII